MAQLQEVFDRYIPEVPISGLQTATPLQAHNGAGSGQTQTVTDPHRVALQGATESDVAARSATATPDVAVRDALEPAPNKECSGVALQTHENGAAALARFASDDCGRKVEPVIVNPFINTG